MDRISDLIVDIKSSGFQHCARHSAITTRAPASSISVQLRGVATDKSEIWGADKVYLKQVQLGLIQSGNSTQPILGIVQLSTEASDLRCASLPYLLKGHRIIATVVYSMSTMEHCCLGPLTTNIGVSFEGTSSENPLLWILISHIRLNEILLDRAWTVSKDNSLNFYLTTSYENATPWLYLDSQFQSQTYTSHPLW